MLHQLDWCTGRLPASGTVSRGIGINRGIRHSKDRPCDDIGWAITAAAQLTQTGQTPRGYGRAFDTLPILSLILATTFVR